MIDNDKIHENQCLCSSDTDTNYGESECLPELVLQSESFKTDGEYIFQGDIKIAKISRVTVGLNEALSPIMSIKADHVNGNQLVSVDVNMHKHIDLVRVLRPKFVFHQRELLTKSN